MNQSVLRGMHCVVALAHGGNVGSLCNALKERGRKVTFATFLPLYAKLSDI